MVGVRVARREGVLVGPIVLVALGERLAVAEGLNARGVGLILVVSEFGIGVGVGEAGG